MKYWLSSFTPWISLEEINKMKWKTDGCSTVCLVSSLPSRKMLVLPLLLSLSGFSSACFRFRRLLLSEALVASVRPLTHVDRVPDSSSCSQLCLREPRCAAIRHHHNLRLCDLLTAHFDLFEGELAFAGISGNVELWAILGRGFGECPANYTVGWQSSRYRRSAEKKSWTEAVKSCEKKGGKLAELTSKDEMKTVVDKLGINTIGENIHIGGYQMPGAEDNDGGWRFLRSGLPVTRSRFRPNNHRNREHHLSIYPTSKGLFYNDISSNDVNTFICECIHIGWKKIWWYSFIIEQNAWIVMKMRDPRLSNGSLPFAFTIATLILR